MNFSAERFPSAVELHCTPARVAVLATWSSPAPAHPASSPSTKSASSVHCDARMQPVDMRQF